jgi:CheY-like chemotaxis protein
MTESIVSRNIVIYADDDKDDLELVQDAFAQYAQNVEVLTFMDGSSVLSFIEGIKENDMLPCLIILDINMPVMNGKEALIMIRQIKQFELVPIVLFTTSSQPIDKNFAERYNAGFITKPLGIRQMEIITDQFIDHCTEEIRRKIRRQIG